MSIARMSSSVTTLHLPFFSAGLPVDQPHCDAVGPPPPSSIPVAAA
jgi:hypothetical protein